MYKVSCFNYLKSSTPVKIGSTYYCASFCLNIINLYIYMDEVTIEALKIWGNLELTVLINKFFFRILFITTAVLLIFFFNFNYTNKCMDCLKWCQSTMIKIHLSTYSPNYFKIKMLDFMYVYVSNVNNSH
jgi:hypothetical protein